MLALAQQQQWQQQLLQELSEKQQQQLSMESQMSRLQSELSELSSQLASERSRATQLQKALTESENHPAATTAEPVLSDGHSDNNNGRTAAAAADATAAATVAAATFSAGADGLPAVAASAPAKQHQTEQYSQAAVADIGYSASATTAAAADSAGFNDSSRSYADVDSSSSWQQYVDQYLLVDLPSGGRVSHGAIIGAESGVWASDPGFPPVTQQEATSLLAVIQAGAESAATKGDVQKSNGKSHGSHNDKSNQAGRVLTIAGKQYEVTGVNQGGQGVLTCRVKRGLLEFGGRGGCAIAATNAALTVAMYDETGSEAGCVGAVQDLAAVLIAYGY